MYETAWRCDSMHVTSWRWANGTVAGYSPLVVIPEMTHRPGDMVFFLLPYLDGAALFEEKHVGMKEGA
jgi:hypothetical protein